MLDLPELEYAVHHQDHQTAMADAPPFEEWCPHEGHPFLTPKFRCSQAPQVFKSLSPQVLNFQDVRFVSAVNL